MTSSGRGYVTIVGRKRLCSQSVSKVGIELLGQLKKQTFWYRGRPKVRQVGQEGRSVGKNNDKKQQTTKNNNIKT